MTSYIYANCVAVGQVPALSGILKTNTKLLETNINHKIISIVRLKKKKKPVNLDNHQNMDKLCTFPCQLCPAHVFSRDQLCTLTY